MPFVTSSDVAAFLKKSSVDASAAIEMAEALVEEEVGNLTYRTVEEQHKVQYAYAADEQLMLRDGPAVSLISMDLDSVELAITDVILSPWSLKRLSGINKGDLVVTYDAGFSEDSGDSGDSLPGKIQQALIGVAAELWSRPNIGLKSERIGDYSYTRMSGEGEPVLGAYAALLLRSYRRPRA